MIAYILPNRNGQINEASRSSLDLPAYKCVNNPIGVNYVTYDFIYTQYSNKYNSFKGYDSIFNDQTIKINSIKITDLSQLYNLNGSLPNYVYHRSFFYIDNNFYYGPKITEILPEYKFYSYMWNKNPATNQNWENIINDLEFGIVLSNDSNTKDKSCCAQIYLEVDYEESSFDSNDGSFLLASLNQ